MIAKFRFVCEVNLSSYITDKFYRQCRHDRGPGRENDLKMKSAPSLFVRGLPSKFNNEMLYTAFRPYGEILSAEVSKNSSGACKGWGLVSSRFEYLHFTNKLSLEL